MSDTEASLLAAIVANPADDAVRLVYADWLEENADRFPQCEALRARADFIRLEIEMAPMNPDTNVAPNSWDQPTYAALKARASDLYNKHARVWFGDLDWLAGESSTHRGFLDHVALTARKFIAHGEEIFRIAPTIRNVFIGRLGRNMPNLAACPALRHVRELEFFETPVRAREAEELAASPHLTDLQNLEMPYTDTQIGPRGARALARPGLFASLQHLDLFNHAIFDEGADALLVARHLATLRELRLGNNGLTGAFLVALARADHLTRLVELELMANHLHGSGFWSLARAPHLAGLESLALSRNPIDDNAAGALAASGFTRLTELRLGFCHLGESGCHALLNSPIVAGLKKFCLQGNRPRSSPFAQAPSAGPLRQLEEFSLSKCDFGPDAARVLARIDWLPALRELALDGNPLGLEGIRQLLDGPLMRPVRALSIEECQLGDDGAEAIANSPSVANLRSLRLGKNQITDRGSRALIQSPHLAELRSVWLRENPIEEATKLALRERFGEKGGWW